MRQRKRIKPLAPFADRMADHLLAELDLLLRNIPRLDLDALADRLVRGVERRRRAYRRRQR